MSQKVITIEEAEEQVALACRRLGLLHLAFAETLVDQLGQDEGKRMTERAIKKYGRMIGEEKRERALSVGPDLGPGSFQSVSDLPSIGMHDRIEAVEVDGETRIRAYGCVMGKVWSDLGKDELGGCYCLVDPASSMAFNQNLKLVHIKALPRGDPYCELVLRPTTREDRAQFESDDTDWSTIEAYGEGGGGE